MIETDRPVGFDDWFASKTDVLDCMHMGRRDALEVAWIAGAMNSYNEMCEHLQDTTATDGKQDTVAAPGSAGDGTTG